MTARRYVSVSEMEDFLKCQWRWYARWRLNRVPRKWSDALILGTAVHDIFERHFALGTSLDVCHLEVQRQLMEAANSAPDPDQRVALNRAYRDLIAFRPQIVGWRDEFRIEEQLEVEEAFEVRVLPARDPNEVEWWFRGRPDRPVVIGGKVIHMQHKTAAIGKNPQTFATYLSRSMHETLYGGRLRDKYRPRPYGGFVLNLIRKGVAKTDADIPRLARQLMVPISDYDIDRAQSRANAIFIEMRKAQALADEHGIWSLVDNPLQDAGVYGNSLDGYLPVLTHKASLDDDTLFMPREETYAEPR